MLGPDLEFCSDVVNVYASLIDLDIFLTDKQGNPLMPMIDISNIFQEILGGDTIIEHLSQRTRDFSKINGPIIYDELPGIKVIICPIYVQAEIEYFVFAGCFIEHSTKHLIEAYLETIFNNDEKVQTILSFLKEFTPDEIQAKIGKVRKLAEILLERLSTHTLKKHLAEQEKKLAEMLQLVTGDDVSIRTVLQRLIKENKKIDFVGYARRKEQDKFVVEVDAMSVAGRLKMASFSTGEGILGQAAATEMARFWDQIQADPRMKYFHQKGIYPKSIFCFPIILEREVTGIFFGGSTRFEQLEKEVSWVGRITAMLISVIENKRTWKDQAQDNLLKMTALNEIFQVMIAVKDLKRIFFIMLDMTINLFQGSFVVFILDHPARKSFEIFSRGLTAAQLDDYSSEISNRYYRDSQHVQIHYQNPIEQMTSWKEKVLEFPIAFRDFHFGFLCIGISNHAMREDELSFLKSLTLAGGLAIHHHSVKNKFQIEQSVIDLLVDLQEYIDPDHFRKASRARAIIKEFSDYSALIPLNTLEVKYSCYFILYDEQFLKEKINNEIIIEILREYNMLMNNEIGIEQVSTNVQVLSMVWTYITSDENIDMLTNMDGINRELLKEFISYLSYSNVIEHEVLLTRNKSVINEPKISKNLKLSKREMDVVQLVLEGKNNRAIAESLFISEHTVKNHMTNIFQKLEVTDRSQAIAKIYQMGFLPEDVS